MAEKWHLKPTSGVGLLIRNHVREVISMVESAKVIDGGYNNRTHQIDSDGPVALSVTIYKDGSVAVYADGAEARHG